MKLALIAFFAILPVLISAETKKFHNASDMYGITITEPNAVCNDDNGFLWVASKYGVLRLADHDSKMFTLPYSSMNVVSVEVASKGTTVVAFTNHGEVFMYNPATDRFENYLDLPAKVNVSSLYLSQIEIDDSGAMWLASSSGLFYSKDDIFKRIDSVSGALGDIAPATGNNMVAGGPEGIYLIDTTTFGVTKLSDASGTFPTLFVYDEDLDQTWVGTMSDGLFYIDNGSHRLTRAPAPDFPRQYVRDIELVTDSTIWCGIDGRGIYELSRDGTRILHTYLENPDNPYSIAGNGIQDMYLDPQNRVWICSFTGGLSVADMNPADAILLAHRTDTRNSLVNNYVYDIEEDMSGQLWIGTNSGLSCWDPATDTWTNFFNDNRHESFIVPAVKADAEGNVWAGTYSNGAYVIDTKTKKVKAHYTQPDGILSKNGFVFDIERDRGGKIWLGGMIGDILRYDKATDSFEAFPSIPVSEMTDFNDSTILLMSTNRLLSLDKHTKEYTEVLSGYIFRDMLATPGKVWLATSGKGLVSFDMKTGKTMAYGSSEGLPTDYANSLMMYDGQIWVGTDNGLYIFNLDEKTFSQYSPLLSTFESGFNPNAAKALAGHKAAWGTSKGVFMLNGTPNGHPTSDRHIYIDDIRILGRSIRNDDEYTLCTVLDDITDISFDYRHDDVAFDILSLGAIPSSPMFSYRLKGYDDSWIGPADISTISYTNLKPGDYDLIIRMHNPNIVAERSIHISITPPFWDTWWFRLMMLLTVVAFILFVLRTYINRLNRRNAESKLQFFVSTAHDLRTALTLIKAPIEQLRYSSHLSEPDRGYVDLASENVDHLTSLTTKLMDFQKIDTGKVQPRFAPHDIPALIRHRIAMFSTYAEQKSLTINLRCSPESYTSAIDSSQMEQVIDNLISNAIKYSPDGSSIDVTFAGDGGLWCLKVSDHGIGIPRRDRKRLFKEFYRGQNAIRLNTVGSGIGLAMVKKLVEIHGGHVQVESQENEGSTFEITVPYNAGTPTTVATPVEPELLTENPDNVEGPDAEGEDMRIVIAEDNNDLRNFMVSALSDRFKVTAVADGAEAWPIIQETLPDLILSDVMMPNMDGFELCRLVKSTFETSHIPLILLSALSEQTSELRGIGLGADEYLTKPFDIKTLSKRISSTIVNRRRLVLRPIEDPSRPEATTADETPNPLNDAFIRQAVEVIISHLDNSEFGKEEFAKEMKVSTSLLFKKIKSLSGLSIVDFIKKVRMEQAMQLITNSSLSISEIAYRCGFSSIAYFSTVFKKYFGKTPSECRKA